MLLLLLKIAHAVLGGISIYAAAAVLVKIFSGRSFERSAIVFLRCVLGASATGLLLDVHRMQFAQLVAMAAVYIAGVAVLALRRSHLGQTLGLVLVLSLIAVFCCDILECVQHVLYWVAAQ